MAPFSYYEYLAVISPCNSQGPVFSCEERCYLWVLIGVGVKLIRQRE